MARTYCYQHPGVPARRILPDNSRLRMCDYCIDCLRYQFWDEQQTAREQHEARPSSFYIYVPDQQGQPYLVDCTLGLSEALEILEMVKDGVPWGCVMHLGRTVAYCRRGKVQLAREVTE